MCRVDQAELDYNVYLLPLMRNGAQQAAPRSKTRTPVIATERGRHSAKTAPAAAPCKGKIRKAGPWLMRWLLAGRRPWSLLEVMVVWGCFSTIAWPEQDGAPMQAAHGIARQAPPVVVCQDSAPPMCAPQEERGGGELMAVHLVFCSCMLAVGCNILHVPCIILHVPCSYPHPQAHLRQPSYSTVPARGKSLSGPCPHAMHALASRGQCGKACKLQAKGP